MVEKGWPWDGKEENDREYGAQQVSDAFKSLVTDGVRDADNDFLVTPLSNGTVRIGSGTAWINGKQLAFYGYEDVSIPFAPVADTPSYGLLVLRLRPGVEYRDFEFAYILPDDSMTENEIRIASIRYDRGTAGISTNDIKHSPDIYCTINSRVDAGSASNINGILKSDGTSVQQAMPGSDYATPAQVDAKLDADDYAHLATPMAAPIAGGASTELTLTLDPPLTAYTPGLILAVQFITNVYTGATLDINGLGAKTIYGLESTTRLPISIGVHLLMYDGTYWRLMDSFLPASGGTVYGSIVPSTSYLALGSDARRWYNIDATNVTTVNLKVSNLIVLGNTISDFVVEQGESGNWTYRKWYRGRAEGWFRNSYASPAFSETTGSGSLCEMALFKMSAALPSGLFAASPDVVTVAASRGTGYYPLGGYINERSASSLSVVVWSTIATGIADLSVELYAAGRWK